MLALIIGTIKAVAGTVSSLFFYAITVKVLAHVLGPAGVGSFSLLRQVQATAVTLATLNGSTAVVRGLALRNGDERRQFLASVFALCLAGVVVVVGALSTFPSTWARWLLADAGPTTTRQIVWVALAVGCGAAWTVVAAVLNGLRDIGGLAWAQGLGAACLAAFVYPLALAIVDGKTYLLAAVLCVAPVASAGLGAWFLRRRQGALWIQGAFWRDWDSSAAREFVLVSSTMLATGFLMAFVQLAVKRIVLGGFGLAGVGIYDAAWSLSNTYVLIVLSSLVTSYLPALAAKPQDRSELLSQTFALSLAMMVPLLLALVVLKPLVITLLYTTAFSESVQIIRWNLIGDYFKTVAFILGYNVLVRGEMRSFLVLEGLYNVVFLAVSYLAVMGCWLSGLGLAHLLAYATLAIAYLILHSKRYGIRLGTPLLLAYAAGLALIVGASWVNWDQRGVPWGSAVLWPAIGLAWSAALLMGFYGRIRILSQVAKWLGRMRDRA